jgi:FkbM family methyltransferase
MLIWELKRIVKGLIYRITGVKRHLKKGIKCNYEFLGDSYGGFYVCPDLLNKNSIVYSFGIGENISFDKSIIEKYQCKVFGFDPTPKSIDWIHNQDLPDGFSFYEYGISEKTEVVNFYLPKNLDHVSGSVVKWSYLSPERCVQVQMKSLKDIVKELGHKNLDILKMDIEGSEYDVLNSIFDTDICINQILVEFHDRFFKNGKDKSINAVRHLKANGYEIFAVSETFDEVSFVRKNVL